jgi:DNA-directed RNA polymerase subunit RPC12/RpoP
MDEIEIRCSSCNEPMYLGAQDYDQMSEGDVIECENCDAVLEIIQLEPLELLVVEGGEALFTTDCPHCGTSLELEETDDQVECPNCLRSFNPDWSEVKDDYNDEDWR